METESGPRWPSLSWFDIIPVPPVCISLCWRKNPRGSTFGSLFNVFHSTCDYTNTCDYTTYDITYTITRDMTDKRVSMCFWVNIMSSLTIFNGCPPICELHRFLIMEMMTIETDRNPFRILTWKPNGFSRSYQESNTWWSVPPTTMGALVLIHPRCSTSDPGRPRQPTGSTFLTQMVS